MSGLHCEHYLARTRRKIPQEKAPPQSRHSCGKPLAAHRAAVLVLTLGAPPRELDFRTTRPSKILATNSETVGFQDHSLRQSAGAQHSRWARRCSEKPSNGGNQHRTLRTSTHPGGLEILSLGPFVSKPPHFVDLVRIYVGRRPCITFYARISPSFGGSLALREQQ